MAAFPLVSVILPTHNRASLLEAAMQSVLAQSYANLELIVVDDASTDATADVVQGVSDPRVRYIRLPQNRRAAHARNVGLTHARGELVAYHDDDDLWLIEKLERQVPHLLEAPADVGLSLAGYLRYWWHGGADYVGGERYFRALDYRRGYIGEFSLVATPGWLIRKDVLARSGGFDERMRAWDDWELTYRLSKLCRFAHLNLPLFVQNRSRPLGGSGGMWDNTAYFANEYAVLIEKHGGDWSPRDRSRHAYLVARHGLSTLPPDQLKSWLRRALQDDPANLKARGLLALVSAGPERALGAIRRLGALKRALTP